MNKKIFFSIILCLSLALSFVYYRSQKNRLNVLILSICSLRLNFPENTEKFPDTPNIKLFAETSFAFENAFTDISWSNVSGFLVRIKSDIYTKNGYAALGDPWPIGWAWNYIYKDTPAYFRRSKIINPKLNYLDQIFSDKENIKHLLLNKENWPFLLEYHLKMLHFPYANIDSKFPNFLKKNFTEQQVKIIESYFSAPEKYPDRILLYLLLGKRDRRLQSILEKFRLVKQVPEKDTDAMLSSKDFMDYAGLLSNRELYKRWQHSKFFSGDLKIVKQFYKIRLKFIDSYIKDFLEGFGDKDFLNNTVIIFMGDHGEAFGEHEYMSHGETTNDEMIHFPLIIKFPMQNHAVTLSNQFYQGNIAKLVSEIMQGHLNEKNFAEYLAKSAISDYIFSKNCAANQFSIRFQNQWKLILDYSNNSKRLYNLLTDPQESINIYLQHPDIAATLEEQWIVNRGKQDSNQMEPACNVMENE